MIGCGIRIKNITLIGHSLGAHVSSFAAKNITQSGYGNIPLLIGIDPAGPKFEGKNCSERFCKTDADRVICIHASDLGFHYSIGDLDLWMNNGVCQPPCGI